MAEQLPVHVKPDWCPSGIADHGVTNIAILALLFVLYTPLVALRLYVRTRINKGLWWDDAAIVGSWLFVTPIIGMGMYSTWLGLGQQFACVDPLNVSKILLMTYSEEVLIIFSIMLARISIALFLIKVFAVSRRVKWSLIAFIIAMATIMSITAILVFPQCHPREKLWKPLLPGHCWSKSASLAPTYLNGTVSTLCDLILALLPIAFIWNIKMRLINKIIIAVLMGMGIFTAACAITRTVLLVNLKSANVTYDLVDLGLFAVLEAAVAIICACIPTLRPLFTKKGMTGSSYGSSGKKLIPGYARSSMKQTESGTSGKESKLSDNTTRASSDPSKQGSLLHADEEDEIDYPGLPMPGRHKNRSAQW